MWIYVPRGSCRSAPAPGCLTSASEWRSRLLASSAALSTKHTLHTFWLRAWKKKLWIQRLFGRISIPFIARSGLASWMASLADTRVNHFPRPGSEKDPTTRGISGLGLQNSSTMSTQAGVSSKTSEGISPSDSTSSTETFESVVSELKRDYSRRRRSARNIKESASSFWPTVRTRSTLGDTGSARRREEGSPRTITGGAESAERKQQLGRETSGGGDLQAAVENWPTPNQRDYKGCDLKTRHGGASLPHFVKTGERIHSQSSLQVPVISVSGDELSPTDLSTALRRRLNPAFVCWLMGWPWWWTNPGEISSARSAMESYLSRLRTLLAFLLDVRD